MNKESINHYRISESKEEYLWKNAIIVFDSSALLDLYFLPKTARKKIENEIYKKLIDRLWLPNHVQYEYLKNREKIIKKPVIERYEPLRKKVQKISEAIKIEIQVRVDEIVRETKMDDKHPHLSQTHIATFQKEVEKFQDSNKVFTKSITAEIKKQEDEILKVSSTDDVLLSLETYFKVGREFAFEEIIAITKEGKHRFEYKIPPGYGDLNSGDKKGTQIFADLIIWKQILEYSKESQKDIIFITNDIKKDEDWCYLDKQATETRILSPREELIKEIKDNSNVDFWMYNLPQFLFYANKHLKSSIQEETIQNMSHLVNTKYSKGTSLKFKCNKCGEQHRYKENFFSLDFDVVGSSERKMGTENHYQADEHFLCTCGADIKAKFEVWEYPYGVHNYDAVKIENAELIESFDFSVDFYKDDEYDYCICHLCAGNRDGYGNNVDLENTQILINDYTEEHINSKFTEINYGECNHCNELHIKCAKCGANTLLGQHQADEEIECEGGCGLKYKLDTSIDTESIGDYQVKLVDDRIEECSKCGKDFVDSEGTEICQKCESEYDEK